MCGWWFATCSSRQSRQTKTQYDGPTAIRPLTVTPHVEHSAPPDTVCDFEHQCYPEKGGPMVPAPVAPPAVVVKPAAPRPQVPAEPIVAT